MLIIYACTTEHLHNPMGLDAPHPRLSWKLKSDRRDVIQQSYQISAFSDGKEIWNSGPVFDSETRNIPYMGPALVSGQQVTWQVAVTAVDGEGMTESAIGEVAAFEMGLLTSEDWRAIWIQTEDDSVDPDARKPVACLRKSFAVRPGLLRARSYQSAHGLYEFWINGKNGTEEKFKPGLTSYYFRTQYQCHDITPLLKEGENVWSIQLADGWWRGNTGGGNYNNFGFVTHYIGQLVLEYADGTTEYVVSDTNMRHSTGGLRYSDLKWGDLYDARSEPEGWKLPGFDDSAWENARPAGEFCDLTRLVPSRSVPVTEHERLNPTILRDANGDLVLDFGQNMAGYVSMTLRNCRPGQQVTLIHGEGLKNGAFSLDNLENSGEHPFQQVDYICKGQPVERYCPNFAVFGFRYVKVLGYQGEIHPGDFVAIAVYSDLEQTGTFTCSNPLINQLVSNSRWSQKSNFLDVPTDCPTRERSPWSGDSQVYCKTATDFMNVYPFFEKWMQDMSLEQFQNGCVGNTIPAANALHNAAERNRMIQQGRFVFAPPTMAGPAGDGDMMDGAAGWGDMATIIPHTMYRCYGDKNILRLQYESAKRWSLYQRACAKQPNPLYADQPQYHTGTDGVLDGEYIFDTRFHWGEWMEPDGAENAGPDAFVPPEMAKWGNPLVATAYLYHSSVLVAEMAGVLGYEEDARDFADYAARVKQVYNRYFIQEDGTILPGRQAPYVRTLAFGLADEANTPKVAAKLAEAVEQRNYRLNTGFLSTPYILFQLCRYGYTDHAFRLLEQTDSPGWLHPVTLGATSIAESWNSFDEFFNSFNHYSYGAVCDFLFSGVTGISPVEDAPGYRQILLKPVVGGTLTHAKAEFESPCGRIVSAWQRSGEVVSYHFEIPANTTAKIVLPEGGVFVVGSGCHDY